MDFKKITNFISGGKGEEDNSEINLNSSQNENQTPPDINLEKAPQKSPDENKAKGDRFIEINDKLEKVRGEVETHKREIFENENKQKELEGKIEKMESQMVKFLSLYEIISNQYNPFIDEKSKEDISKSFQVEKIQDSLVEDEIEENRIENENEKLIKEDNLNKIDEVLNQKPSKASSKGLEAVKQENIDDELDESLLDLDTLNIKNETAGIPLKKLKTDTNSLVILLNWLKYLVKICGHQKTREALKYYAEVLKWISSEVYFEIDKYLDGLEIEPNKELCKLRIKDHIVSLYFISKLNNGVLDKKLVDTVLKIIKKEHEK